MPETWDGLSKSSLFATPFLQHKVDYVKYRLFASVVSPSQEASVYNPIVLEYAGKFVALQLIRPGMDYWASQPVTESISGADEQVSFTDRSKTLLDLEKALRADIADLAPLVQDDIVFEGAKHRGAAIAHSAPWLTPSPADLAPRAYPELPYGVWE